MGLIRGTLFTIIAILLFVSLLLMNTFWSISKSLEYDNIKTELVPVITDLIVDQSDTLFNLEEMQFYCQNQNNTSFIVTPEELPFEINCDNVFEGFDSIVSSIVEKTIEEKYYQEYDCKFWQCPMDPPYHLVSEKAKDYWSEWFYVFLIISIIFAVVDLFLIENKNDYPFILGGLIIISSLIFAKIEWLLSFLGSWEFLGIVRTFFSQAYNIFLIMFILGIVLILIGIALKFLGLGQWLLKVFSKKKD